MRCEALIVFIGLSPRYSPHACSTIFIMIRDAYSTTFIVIRGVILRKQPWGRHWRHEKPTSLYFLTGESHVSEYADVEYILINLIPTDVPGLMVGWAASEEGWWSARIFAPDFSGLVSFPVSKRDLAHTYRTHNPSNPESNGRQTEHQIGEGFTEIDTRALVAMITTSYQKIQQKSGNF